MFVKRYDKTHKNSIKTNNMDRLNRLNELYSYSISLNELLYDESGIIRGKIDYEPWNLPLGYLKINNDECYYGLLFGLNSALNSLIYNKVLGLTKTKGTANIIRSAIEYIGTMKYMQKGLSSKENELFRLHFKIQEMQFAEMYFSELKKEKLKPYYKYNYDYAIKRFCDLNDVSIETASKEYKKPLGWMYKPKISTPTIFAFLKNNVESEIFKIYQLASMQIYNYNIEKNLTCKINENYFVELLYEVIQELVNKLELQIKNKNISIMADYMKLVNPGNKLNYHIWTNQFDKIDRLYGKLSSQILNIVNPIITPRTKHFLESHDFLIEVLNSFLFGLIDTIRFKFKVLLENTCITNILMKEEYRENIKILEKLSKLKLSEILNSEGKKDYRLILNDFLEENGFISSDIDTSTLGYLVTRDGKKRNIRDILIENNFSINESNHYYNGINASKTRGLYDAYYKEANYIDHPSMYQYAGEFGVDSNVTQDILPFILDIIANIIMGEVEYIGSRYSILKLYDEKIMKEINTNAKNLCNAIIKLRNQFSITPSKRHKDYIK